MSSKNPSFVLKSVKDLIFEERPVPRIQNPTDVLIRVNVTGICGSDVSLSYPCSLFFLIE